MVNHRKSPRFPDQKKPRYRRRLGKTIRSAERLSHIVEESTHPGCQMNHMCRSVLLKNRFRRRAIHQIPIFGGKEHLGARLVQFVDALGSCWWMGDPYYVQAAKISLFSCVIMMLDKTNTQPWCNHGWSLDTGSYKLDVVWRLPHRFRLRLLHVHRETNMQHAASKCHPKNPCLTLGSCIFIDDLMQFLVRLEHFWNKMGIS